MLEKIPEILENGIKWIVGDIEGKGALDIFKRLLVVLLIIIFVIIAWILLGKENYWKEHYQKPLFSFCEESNQDYIKSNISLREGNVIVTPLLSVRYNGKIIRTIKLSNYYNNNEAVLISDKEGESYFLLEVDELHRKKLMSVSTDIKEMLQERSQEIFDVEVVYLADIMYQNKESDKSHKDIYWYLSSKETKRITELEKQLWEPEYVLDVEEYEIEGFKYNNTQLMMIVNGCMDVVSK